MRRPSDAAPQRLGKASQQPPAGRPTVDQLSEWSFPASDPPPSWTWEVSPLTEQADEANLTPSPQGDPGHRRV
jgi:hypothetical protein